jgi:DNA-binding transcriptional LysR family regulator
MRGVGHEPTLKAGLRAAKAQVCKQPLHGCPRESVWSGVRVDWDDLKFLLAVADGGGLAGAARTLKVDPSTVSRRINALEKALGAELVARTPEGMTLTPAGEQTVAASRQIESQLASLTDALRGERGELAGTLRIATTESFAPTLLRTLPRVRERHPGLAIDVLTAVAPADLRRREADLAVRMFRDDRDGLAMRKLGTLGWSLYASERYLARKPRGTNLLDGHEIVGYNDELVNMPGAVWLAAHAQPEAIRVRCGGTRGALDAALADAGVCIVPCYLAANQPIVRLTDQVLASGEAYVVFLPERRGEVRIRVAIDALVALFEGEQATFSGQCATATT